MNILLLKQLSILSLFVGAIFGLLTVIPYISLFTFLLLILCLSAFVLVYMKQNDLIGLISVREGCIFGSVIGFVSFIGFSIVYTPISMLLGALIEAYPQKHFNYFISDFGTFIVTVLILLFIAAISALFNGFSGLLTAYVYELLSGQKKEANENNTVDFSIE